MKKPLIQGFAGMAIVLFGFLVQAYFGKWWATLGTILIGIVIVFVPMRKKNIEQ
jgi:hypothetical protein